MFLIQLVFLSKKKESNSNLINNNTNITNKTKFMLINKCAFYKNII